METLIITGVVAICVVGFLMTIWRLVLRILAPVFTIATIVIVLGFVFGGTELFTNGSVSDWTDVATVLLGEGTGERVVNAFISFIQNSIEIIQSYY